MKILKIKNISKKYYNSNSFAVNDFSLSIDKGELLCLVGESGSGKTTILRLIAGFEQLSSGVIEIDNTIVSSNYKFISPDKRNIGMVFQNYALFPHLTVKKNILFGLRKSDESKKKFFEVLNFVGLFGFEDKYPFELSGGQQQRTALARTIILNPKIVLFDEPFSNLDNKLKEKVRNDLKNILKKGNITSIIVTHDIKDALSIADRIVIIRNGILQQVDIPYEIYCNPINNYIAQYFGEINRIKSLSVNNGFISELGFIHCNDKLPNSKDIILNIRSENIEICEFEMGICKGCVKSVVY